MTLACRPLTRASTRLTINSSTSLLRDGEDAEHGEVNMENAASSDSTVSSSPSGPIFSDEVQLALTPPSSPSGFPWEQAKPMPPGEKALPDPGKTAFSVLGKRKALEPRSDNAQSKKRQLAKPRKSSTQHLTQMQISLGQKVATKCKTCGMEYIRSSAEDRKWHDLYHKQNTEGCDVGKDFVKKARVLSTFAGARDGDTVFQLDCFDDIARKRRGQAVLEIVQRELGAVEIPEKAIWDPKECSCVIKPDWNAYLYVRGTKCIGFLLTQSIKEAYRLVEPADPGVESESQMQNSKAVSRKARDALKARQEAAARRLEESSKRPIELSNYAEPAALGISRIWTSAVYRRQSIAQVLLDTALKAERFWVPVVKGRSMKRSARLENDYDRRNLPIQKLHSHDDIAFSQPTESGTKLARAWFGKTFGWKVYVD